MSLPCRIDERPTNRSPPYSDTLHPMPLKLPSTLRGSGRLSPEESLALQSPGHEHHPSRRSRRRVLRSAAAPQTHGEAAARFRRRRMRGAAHRSRRHHPAALRRQRLPVPHRSRRVRGASGLAGRVPRHALGHSQHRTVVRPRHRSGPAASAAPIPDRDDAAVRRSARCERPRGGHSRDRRRGRHAVDPLLEVRGQLRRGP